MSMTIDKPHVLVITDHSDGYEKEWRIVHPPTCSWDGWSCDGCNDPLHEGDGKHMHFWRVCYTQWEIDANGLDGLEIYSLDTNDHIDPDYVPATPFEPEWLKLKPGRYSLNATYTWSGSWHDEPDSEFYIESVIA